MANPPPRLIGVRHVALSSVIGVIISLASIVVGVIAPWTASIRAVPPRAAQSYYWLEEEYAVLVALRRAPGLTIPGYSFAQGSRAEHEARTKPFGDMPRVSQDPRPAWSVEPFRGTNEVILARASGWPWPAAHGHRRRSVSSTQWNSSDGLVSLGFIGIQEYVPIRPMWFGLAGNALVWSALVLACVAAERLLRRGRRRRKNRCITCGYEVLAVSGPCPECGTYDPKLAKRTA
ncbi:MAG: hypothetical protein ACFCBV_07415 [Phycisphaerales bacterium]